MAHHIVSIQIIDILYDRETGRGLRSSISKSNQSKLIIKKIKLSVLNIKNFGIHISSYIKLD